MFGFVSQLWELSVRSRYLQLLDWKSGTNCSSSGTWAVRGVKLEVMMLEELALGHKCSYLVSGGFFMTFLMILACLTFCDPYFLELAQILKKLWNSHEVGLSAVTPIIYKISCWLCILLTATLVWQLKPSLFHLLSLIYIFHTEIIKGFTKKVTLQQKGLMYLLCPEPDLCPRVSSVCRSHLSPPPLCDISTNVRGQLNMAAINPSSAYPK